MEIMELLEKDINGYLTYRDWDDLQKTDISSVCRPHVTVFTKPLLYLTKPFFVVSWVPPLIPSSSFLYITPRGNSVCILFISSEVTHQKVSSTGLIYQGLSSM